MVIEGISVGSLTTAERNRVKRLIYKGRVGAMVIVRKIVEAAEKRSVGKHNGHKKQSKRAASNRLSVAR